MQNYVLYMSVRSPFARRARLVLEELKISYEPRMVDVFHPTPAFLEVNPLGRVPVLELANGSRVIDSFEILDYLRDRYGTHPLFQQQGVPETEARSLSAVATGIMEHVVQYFLETLRAPGQQNPEFRQDAIDVVARGFRYLATEFRGPYVLGAALSTVDFDLGAAIGYCDFRLGKSYVDAHPALRDYFSRLSARASFQKTVPVA